MTSVALEHIRGARIRYFTWRQSSGIAAMISLCVFFAALTGAMARVSFMLPWTPVPVTGQTFAVLLAGVVLGRWGSLSQAMYICLGAAGIPWFAAGAGPVYGPTMGYLAGFIAAPYVVGRVTEAYPRARSFLNLVILLMLVNFIVIHGPGVAWLYAWLKMAPGGNPTFMSAMAMGSLPFIPGDMLKILFAAIISHLLLPKNR